MYVAIKDNKIIAISETDSIFPSLNYDEIKEIEETVEDYIDIGTEFVLKTEEKGSTYQNEQKIKEVKAIRDNYLQETLARCDRYEKQKSAEIETVDSAETYKQCLLYLQYLRDVPQSEGFPNDPVKTFEEWRV